MKFKTIKEARQAYGAAVDELQNLTGNADKFRAKEQEIADVEAEIGRLEREQRASAAAAHANGSVGDGALPLNEQRALDAFIGQNFSPNGRAADAALAARFRSLCGVARRECGMQFEAQKHFRSLGDQLQAIQSYYISRGVNADSRLVRAPIGAGEVDPTGGGFLVQIDFATAIFMLAHEMGEIFSRVNKIPVSEKSNGIKIPGVDETSRVTGSRWGGVQSYWVDEGTQPTTTKPKFRMIEFSLHKLMSLMYVTDELLMDSTALTSIAGQAFSEEIMFMTEDGIYEGTGAGQPLGILNSPALVSITKQPGQAAATIVKENIDSMWARCWARSRKNAVWYINQDCEPQLNQMGQIVGTGGLPVYLPPGGLSATPFGTLYGRPVIAVEYSAALGAPGDILLADLSQYTVIDKGGVQAATSMHIAFLTDQMVFRITYRVDGQPMWSKPLTPFKGTLTKSPFIAIAQR